MGRLQGEWLSLLSLVPPPALSVELDEALTVLAKQKPPSQQLRLPSSPAAPRGRCAALWTWALVPILYALLFCQCLNLFMLTLFLVCLL